jgi:hypothetical protein
MAINTIFLATKAKKSQVLAVMQFQSMPAGKQFRRKANYSGWIAQPFRLPPGAVDHRDGRSEGEDLRRPTWLLAACSFHRRDLASGQEIGKNTSGL